MARLKFISHMEYLMASTAASAGKKSSTATSLFSFFLSVNRVKGIMQIPVNCVNKNEQYQKMKYLEKLLASMR